MNDCELCRSDPAKILWGNEWFYAVDAGTPDYPAYIRLISRRHVPEMSDLSDAEREYLWQLLDAAERTMRRCVQPDKINYAQFGNMVPHLHWHLIGRWRGDAAFPDNAWLPKVREVPEETARARSAAVQTFLKALPAALDAVGAPRH